MSTLCRTLFCSSQLQTHNLHDHWWYSGRTCSVLMELHAGDQASGLSQLFVNKARDVFFIPLFSYIWNPVYRKEEGRVQPPFSALWSHSKGPAPTGVTSSQVCAAFACFFFWVTRDSALPFLAHQNQLRQISTAECGWWSKMFLERRVNVKNTRSLLL